MDLCCTTISIYLLIATSASPSKGDSLKIFPGQIIGPTTVKAGGNLTLNCCISNIKRPKTETYMYLCKNGVGERLQLLGNKDEHLFILRNISLWDSGNYSCMYSFTKYPEKNVRAHGINSIHVQVTGYSLEIFPAVIFGTPTAKVGGNLILKCIIATIQKPNAEVHMYLCKNGVGERLAFHKNEHSFILRNISLWDTGNYSCMYSFMKYPTKDVTGSGINSIHVQVTDLTYEDMALVPYNPQLERNVIRLLFSVGVIGFACFIVIFDIKTRLQPESKAKDGKIKLGLPNSNIASLV